ncbi:MAG: cytochrome-c oxidase, cbb3-type subunit III [Aquabacterium sp.]|uniref:cytochrome-c oxidase, cbb3-type subunit III n=1 Tax=Aquabacterium sp. TaxID=1872578 RepID=UPI003BC6B2C7
MSDFISSGWSWYVIAIVVFGLVYCAFVLIGAAKHKVIYDADGNVDKTTGHVWDGDLRELNNPLPRWWLMLFIITLVFGVAYFALYPGLGDAAGKLNWSSKGQLDAEIAKAQAEEAKVYAKFKTMSVEDMARDPQAHAIGQRLFLNNCAACHGSDAKGAKSFPNLTDTDWLHGGSPDKILETITHGRRGQMPVMAAAVGGPEEVRQVANYVLSLSGSGHNSILAELGKEKFKAVCAACHGADGKGNQAIGAPNLTDKIWLHGFGEQAIMDMVNNGKTNVMPAQEARLTSDQIKVVASYIWGLSNVTQAAEAK